ncbi:MAG: hypothetical protein ACI32F_04320 [Allobaculum sp.]
MKKLAIAMVGAMLMFVAAGCAGQSTTTSSVSEDTSVSEATVESVDEFESLKNALTSQGFEITEQKGEDRSVFFVAKNDEGAVEVYATEYEEEDSAGAAYADQISELTNESFQTVNSYATDGKDLTVMIDDPLTQYAYVAYDVADLKVYRFENVLEGNGTNVEAALNQLGFKTAD